MIELQPNEKIIKAARKHWFVFLLEVVILFFAAVTPFFILFMIDSTYYLYPFLVQISNTAITLFFLAGWFLFIWMFFFVIWTDYYLDVLIVTNQRIVDIEQIGLFARDVTTSPLERIQEVRIEILGFLPTLLRFGNLHIQTAGPTEEIVIKGVRDPLEVKKIITEAYNTHKNYYQAPQD